MIETTEDRERFLCGARCRGWQGIADGGGPSERLQRGREDLCEQLSGTGARVERGDAIGDLAQDVADRRVTARTVLLIGLVSSGALIHALDRTGVRFRKEGLRGMCG